MELQKVNDSPQRRPVVLITPGAGRGSERMTPFLAEYNCTSTALELVPLYVDPVPGKAKAAETWALARGLTAAAVESSGEALLASSPMPADAVVVAAVDRASSLLSLIEQAAVRCLWLFAYLVLRTPAEELAGLRLVLGPADRKAASEATALLRAISLNAPRVGSDAVFTEGPAEMVDLEPTVRSGFADHLTRNVPRVINGVEPASSPIELEIRGVVHPVMVVSHPTEWASPPVLATEVRDAANATPLMRGRSIVVAEVGPKGALRLHFVRLRAVDGRLSVQGNIAVDAESYARAAKEREEEAIRRAKRMEINALNPVYTTD